MYRMTTVFEVSTLSPPPHKRCRLRRDIPIFIILTKQKYEKHVRFFKFIGKNFAV